MQQAPVCFGEQATHLEDGGGYIVAGSGSLKHSQLQKHITQSKTTTYDVLSPSNQCGLSSSSEESGGEKKYSPQL